MRSNISIGIFFGCTIRELVKPHVSCSVQHGLILGIVQRCKFFVSGIFVITNYGLSRSRRQGITASLGPVNHRTGSCFTARIAVVNALNQHLAEFRPFGSIGVVVANLLKRHIHRVVLVANHNLGGANLLNKQCCLP